ncbi:tRNA (adenosine(37)-N6)-dimethylallyltransferase MiaA [Candidatus Falkowbacteria bacterium]|jgi:tRNA dimethylallyltransferase|nr:tRNA (adenosine(37)-N6)-dimethylallyltransferase MiaA [Candidatus Falkowbacteria bacterium]MBT7007671.1 tRNA (adenosine(37)-N6)-dimethylallyltransferase MiaA [Candidatus Falkowbacteria bacterium]
MDKKKVIIVLGPTGSGKSEIAYKIAKDFNGFLIVADSRQIYQKMAIGTNKDPVELENGKYYWKGIEECLVNIVAPDKEFTLDDWLKACKKCIKDHPDQLPVIVGGTGLYLSALVNNYQLGKGYDPKLRQKAEKLLKTKGIEYLLSEIKKIDPEIEHKIESTNSRRVLRAYQICSSTREPLTFEKGESEYEFVQFGMKTEREKLCEKLDKRAKEQFDEGLVEEVKNLLDNGIDSKSPALSGIGYKNVVKYLQDEISMEDAIELNQRDNRRYAKRQMTWFKRDRTISWIDNYNQVNKILKNE